MSTKSYPPKPTKCDIANIVAHSGIRIGQFQWRFPMREEHLRRRMRGTATFPQFLHEYFADNDIVLVPENGAKDDGDTIGLRLHIPKQDRL